MSGSLPSLAGLSPLVPIGSGGFAIVYAAVDDAGVDVAVKIARRRGPTTVSRFDAEARALALIGPPSVPRLIRRGETAEGRPFLVLERLRGRDLRAWLDARVDAPGPDEWLPLVRALGVALAEVHRAGLVHRDLKPENVFVKDDGGVALLDFGLVAGGAAEGVTRAGATVGTSAYAAPEQLRGERVAPSADLYALGVIAYELSTGRLPFVGDVAATEHAHLVERPAPPSQHTAGAAPYDAVILACLAKQPSRRPPSVAAAIAGLDAAQLETVRVARDERPTLRTQGERPVALIGLTGAPLDEVAALARRHGAIVARVARDHCVLAIADHDAPLDAALVLALAATPRVTAAVVHLAALRVRVDATRGATRLFGAALDAVEAWLPRDARGVLVTAAAAPAIGQRLRPAPVAGCFEPDARGELDAPIFGRDRERGELADAIDRGDGLVTAIGGAGAGKTTLARTAAELAIARLGAARVVVHDARRRRAAGRDGLVELAAAVLQRAVPGEADPAVACAHLVDGGARLWAELAAPLAERRQLDAAHALAAILAAAAPLAVIVDDAHAAELEVLDAIELATAAAGPALLVVVVAAPRLIDLRPRWSTRAHRSVRLELAALDAGAAAACLRALLAPATRIPSEAVERLVRWAGAVPQQLVDLARALRSAGAIRAHPGSDEHYLAGDRVDELPPSASAQWLAERELAALPPALAALARVCAVLGDEVDPDELTAVQGRAELADHLDARAGLDALVRAGVLTGAGGGHRFRQPSLHESCYALTAPDARAAIHERAFEHWRSAPPGTPARALRMAHHGARSGHVAEARDAHLELAAAAARRHAYGEAEQHYDHALALIAEDEPAVRRSALAARGAVRRHLTHYELARADLIEARALAEALGDRLAIVELLVAESAVCDFLQRYGEAAALADEAARRAPATLPPALQARLDNWLGVARFHQHRDDEAIERLGRAVALGAAVGDHESEVGASLILAHAFVRAGRGEVGLALLDRAIARCRAAGDHFHLACAYSNRVVVWRELGASERATADLAAVVAIARDFGFALLEAAGLANLAEHLCWQGRLEGALAASGAAHRQSVQRFRDRPLAVVSLYHAQLLVLTGRDDEARAALRELGAVDVDEPAVALMRDAVGLALAGGAAGWDALHARAAALAEGLQPVEMLWLEGRTAARRGDRARARDRLERAWRGARASTRTLATVIAHDLRRVAPPAVEERRALVA